MVDIVPLSKNKFKAILPNGDEKIYLIESGDVIEISSSNEAVGIFSPKNNDNINLDNFTISLYICALIIMIFMVFDDYFSIRPIYRLFFQFFISGLMIALSGEYLSNLGNLLALEILILELFQYPLQ